MVWLDNHKIEFIYVFKDNWYIWNCQDKLHQTRSLMKMLTEIVEYYENN